MTVRPGQVWADEDPRGRGRLLRVESVEDGWAYCSSWWEFSGRTVEGTVDHPARSRERRTRVAVSRMAPGTRGYRLVEESDSAG